MEKREIESLLLQAYGVRKNQGKAQYWSVRTVKKLSDIQEILNQHASQEKILLLGQAYLHWLHEDKPVSTELVETFSTFLSEKKD